MAIFGILGAAVQLGEQVFGGKGGPSECFPAVDAMKAKALAGDEEARRHLSCLGGNQEYAADYNALAPPGCGYGNGDCRAYAKAAYLEVEAKRQVGQGLVKVGSAATIAGAQLQPGGVPAAIGTAIAGIPTWAKAAAAVLLGFVVYKVVLK